MEDPLIYKVLAFTSLAIWSWFLYDYGSSFFGRKRRNGEPRRPEPFTGAMVALAVAMIVYSLATIFRQVFGMDYPGRDFMRIFASSGLQFVGITFDIVLRRERARSRRSPGRRATDQR